MTAHLPRALAPLTRPRTRAAADAAAADQLLGPDHALTRALRASQTAIEQLLTLTVVDASAAGLMSGGSPFGARLLAGSLLLQWGIALWLMITRQAIQDESRALMITGDAPRTLACVERERRRLTDPRTRERLARSLEDLLRRAKIATSTSAAADLFLHLFLVNRLEPELREIAALLRADVIDPAAVALVERLLTDAESPLHGLNEHVLREEMARISSRLLDAGP